MPRESVALQGFNKGVIDKLGLARTDIKRTALSSEIQDNWMPRVLGSMMLRPGWQYLSPTLNNAKAYHVPFIFSKDDTAIIELTDQNMRVRVNEQPITRATVATIILNGDFDTDLTGWTDGDQAGCTSQWLGGQMVLTGARYNAAKRYQAVDVAAADIGKLHAININVTSGPVIFSVGMNVDTDEYVAQTTLGTGYHSLAFTPSGSFTVNVSARNEYAAYVDRIKISSSGEMNIPAPWLEADLPLIRYSESADVIYLACDNGYQQHKIERRSIHSWSLVLYQTDDGPFGLDNVDTTRLTPSGLTGDITIDSDRPYFKAGHLGALIRMTSIGQNVTLTAGGDGQFTDPIRITGVGADRAFTYTITGTWVGTIRLQRSVGDTSSWTNVSSFTNNQNHVSFNDGFDNQVIYYRLGFDVADYTSGTADLTLAYVNDGLTGIARVTNVNSNTQVAAQVLVPLGNITASEIWAIGDWCPLKGYPTAVELWEGRLWWAGRAKIWGSVADGYESFDGNTIGDAGPINRSIGQGPVDQVNFLLGLNRLMAGTSDAEWNCRSTSLDEPLTPSNFNMKAPSTQGSSPVQPVKLDDRGIFVHRGGAKLFQLDATGDYIFANYHSADMSQLTPDLCAVGIVRIAIQRQVDTRIHCVLADGTVAILIVQPTENVLAWITVSGTNAFVEDVVIMPGDVEDLVYYSVKRTINGQTVRYLEKWALESECQGGTLNKQADAFITGTNAVASTTITGLMHLAGQNVVVWADGKDVGGAARTQFLVDGTGKITVPVAVTDYVVGLYYEAKFKSTKLAYAAGGGTALTFKKKIDHMGAIMSNTHAQGLRYGPTFDTDPTTGLYIDMDSMPMVERDEDVPFDTIWTEYDLPKFEFKGTWDTDSRLCLLAQAPRPCTLLAAIVGIETNG